jgi:hypothetical protein
MWITAKLGLEKLRGSKGQFVSAMYLRGELALKLQDEGYRESCIVPFLNSELGACWWIRNKDQLKEQFLGYINNLEAKLGTISKKRVVFLLYHRLLIKIQYKLHIILGSISYK